MKKRELATYLLNHPNIAAPKGCNLTITSLLRLPKAELQDMADSLQEMGLYPSLNPEDYTDTKRATLMVQAYHRAVEKGWSTSGALTALSNL